MSPHRELYWRNILFLSLSPFAAVVGVGLYVSWYGLHTGDLVCFGLMLACAGLAVNAGYHQYYSHRSHECHLVVQMFYLFFGAAAIQQSALT
jgi:stearoyl-CoA desaturase (delta-9 desaturase)